MPTIHIDDPNGAFTVIQIDDADDDNNENYDDYHTPYDQGPQKPDPSLRFMKQVYEAAQELGLPAASVEQQHLQYKRALEQQKRTNVNTIPLLQRCSSIAQSHLTHRTKYDKTLSDLSD